MDEPVRRKGTRPTIKDVAQAAGVSPMTVSNVLNNRLQYVGAATKKRVEREIRRLGYRRQASARNLRVAEQRSIGMLIVDESPFFLADQFTCQVVAGLANVLNTADYTLTLQGMRSDQVASSNIMRNFEVAGFCAMLSGPPAERQRVVDMLAELEQPVVLFQQRSDTAHGDLCVVRQDDEGGGRLIADHLLARRVADYLVIVPRQGWPAVENRVAGLRDGLRNANAQANIEIVEAESESFADVQIATARYLDTHAMPGAIVGANDPIASAAMQLVLERGVRVPEDMKVVGFNAFEVHRYAQPPLTTVRSAPYALGEQAGHAMLRRLNGDAFDTGEYLLPVLLEPRKTT